MVPALVVRSVPTRLTQKPNRLNESCETLKSCAQRFYCTLLKTIWTEHHRLPSATPAHRHSPSSLRPLAQIQSITDGPFTKVLDAPLSRLTYCMKTPGDFLLELTHSPQNTGLSSRTQTCPRFLVDGPTVSNITFKLRGKKGPKGHGGLLWFSKSTINDLYFMLHLEYQLSTVPICWGY